ncbi:MAG TPA: CAP domain-containing protein [Thermoanaerobaculia bacterium]|nr:CAP domain-containing protein [Thermoanaerobaculia bacterium]
MRELFILAVAILATPAFASNITRASVVAEMNVRRAAFGLPALQKDSRLDGAADDRINDMEDLDYWGHVSPEGREPFVWLKPHGYDYRLAGENLAAGFDTVEILVDAWMESKGHRANILSPEYRDVGVAIVDGLPGGRGAGKSVVVLFGRQKPDLAAATRPAPKDRHHAPRP